MAKSNVGQFEEWLKKNGLKDKTVARLIEEDITDKSLLCDLDKEDIKGFEFTVGQRKKIERIIASIKADQQAVPQESDNRKTASATGVSGGNVEHSIITGILKIGTYVASGQPSTDTSFDIENKTEFQRLMKLTQLEKEQFEVSIDLLGQKKALKLFVRNMFVTYKALLVKLSRGSVVFTFLHETKEDAQYMMDDRENVLKSIREFLKKLDSSMVYYTIVSEVEDLSQKDLYHFNLLKVSLLLIEQDIDKKAKLIFTLGSVSRQRALDFLSGEIDTLKLYDIKIQGYKMLPGTNATLKDPKGKQYSQRDGSDEVQETGVPGYAEIEDLQKRLRDRKQLFPLMKNVVSRDKEMIFYLQAKKSFLTKATKLEGKAEILGFWKPKKTGLKSDAVAGLVNEEQDTTGGTETELLKSRDRVSQWDTGDKTTTMPLLQRDLLDKDWGDIAELRDKLQQMKKRTVNQGKELSKTCKGDSQEWEYKLDYLSKEIPVLAIYPCITDVFGEDLIPVSVDKKNKKDIKDVTDPDITGLDKVSPVHKLRQFQHGRLTNRKVIDILRKVIIKDNSALSDLHAEIAYLEQVYGCPVHMVGEVDSPRLVPVSCKYIYIDSTRNYKSNV